MVTLEDLESFIIRINLDYSELAEGMYLVRSPDEDSTPIVVHHSVPLLLLRLKVVDLPEGMEDNADLYRTLLVLNASDVVHGAYGLDEGELIISDTLELETLDFHEFQASIESIQFAMAGHLEQIRDLAGLGTKQDADAAAADAGEVES